MQTQRYFAATLLASVIGLMASGVAVAAEPAASKPMAAASTKPALKPVPKTTVKPTAKATLKPIAKPMVKPMRKVMVKPARRRTYTRTVTTTYHAPRALKAGDWCDCGWRKEWAFDGVFGPHTLEGVMEFQRHAHIKDDGIVGPQTQRTLGMAYKGNLKAGDKGANVLALQHALARYAMMHSGRRTVTTTTTTKPTPSPKPSMKPTPMPTMKPTPAPTMKPTPAPTPMPTMKPTPMPSAMMASPAPSEEPQESFYRPTLELRGGDWMLPVTFGGNDYDFGFKRPAWNGEAKLWAGDWGVGAGVTDFQSFQTSAAGTPVGPVYMYNGDVLWRGARGLFDLKLGYRGLNTQGLNFGEVGFGWDIPLGMDWLLLQLHGTGGYNFSNAYFVDGLAGLELRFGPVGIDAGFRDMYLSAPGTAGTQTTNFMGPQASIDLRF